MDATVILRSNGLSKTRNRVNIINTLKRSSIPLSGKEICILLDEKCDKSTVYRALNSLFEKQIIQRVIIDHEVKYALRENVDRKNGHDNDHLHFKCSACNTLFCLREIEIEDFELPEGFVKEENQFLIIGKCSTCQ